MIRTRRSIPAVSGHPLVGSLFEVQRSRHAFLLRVQREHGDIARARVGLFEVVVVSSPELAHEVLVKKEAAFVKSRGLSLFARPLLGDGLLTSEGEAHRSQRRLIAPAFTPGRIATYADVMVERAEGAVRRMLQRGEVDAADETMRVTLDIVGKTLFDAEVSDAASEVGQALSEAMDAIMGSLSAAVPLPPAVPSPRNLRLRRAVARLDKVVFRLIEERRARPGAQQDLLSMLLAARDQEGGRMTNRQVRDEAMTALLAGHETTANALVWALTLLSRNPGVRARLQSEVDAALGGRAARLDDLSRMPLALRVVKEAMRLYPPAYFVGRRATERVSVGGYELDQGAIVFVNIAGIHRRPELYPEPERFEPERFTEERERALPRHAFMPFGAGPRICVGNHFALMEAQLVLSTWMQRATFDLVAPARPIETEPLLTLRPKGEVSMRVTRRMAAADDGGLGDRAAGREEFAGHSA